MIIEKFVAPPLGTNAYLVGCEATKEGVIIDPGFQSKWPLLALVKQYGLSIKAIYLTHSHFDHTADVFELKVLEGFPVFVHPADAENLRAPGSDGIPNMMGLKPVEPDGFFNDGDQGVIGKLHYTVIHTPGHSPGCVCFYFPDEKVLFSGDTIFKGSHGRVDLTNSSPEAMKGSLQKLKALPEDVLVYPGHGPTTTLHDEFKRRWFK